MSFRKSHQANVVGRSTSFTHWFVQKPTSDGTYYGVFTFNCGFAGTIDRPAIMIRYSF